LARVHGEIVQVHRVPAAQLIQRTVEDRAHGVGWAARVVRLLRAVAPADPTDPAGWPLWRQLLPHILAVTDPARHLADAPAEVAWLLDHGAAFLLARGRTEARPRPGHRLLRPLPPPTRPRPPRYPDIRPHPDRRPARPRPARPGPPPARGGRDRCRHAPTANTR
jgi:hypothetical protein